MRLTKEREAEIRAHAEVDGCDGVDDLLAELDAVRSERDGEHTARLKAEQRAEVAELALDGVRRSRQEWMLLAQSAERGRNAARADERAKVVAWLNRRANELDAATRGDGGSIDAYKADAYDAAADAIERGEHEVKP